MSRDIIRPSTGRLEHSGDSRAAIAELLAQSRRLIDRAIDEHQGGSAGAEVGITRLRPGEGWEGELQQLLRRVRREAMLMVSSPLRMQPHYPSSRVLVADCLATGRQVRLLYSRHYVETRDPTLLQDYPQIHAQTRVIDADFYNMLLVDNQIAAIWGGVSEQRPHGLVVRDPALLRVMGQFSRILWESACTLSVHLDLEQAEFDETTLTVLQALHRGLKDEVAARQLSVSLRTYRRYVADIMVRLGVTTRFQIGARAAELGLLAR